MIKSSIKKRRIILTAALLFFLIPGLQAQSTSLENINRILSSEEYPGLNQLQERWLLCMSAIIFEANGSSTITLEPEPLNETSSKKWRRSLERDWGIESRPELLEMLASLEDYGHHGTFAKLKNIAEKEPETDIETLMEEYELSANHAGRFLLIRNNMEFMKEKTLLAWDLGRSTSLIRWGYATGFLSETEAWKLMIYYGKSVMEIFPDWESYMDDYYTGRVVYAAGIDKFDDYNTETIQIKNALFEENGLLESMPWKIPLP